MSPAEVILFVLLLALAAAGGAAALLFVFSAGLLPRPSPGDGGNAPAGGRDSGSRFEAALALGLPLGLLLGAFPGWLLSAFFRVPLNALFLPLWAISLLAIVFSSRRALAAAFKPLSVWIPLALFLVAGAFYLWLRFRMSDIRQTEKPMDFAIFTALLNTPSLPLLDPWYAGERFPYYHFGALILAGPLRISGLAPEYGYNLLVVLLAAMAASGAYGAIRLRGGGRPLALLGGSLLVLAGTFDGARQFIIKKELSGIDLWPSSRRVMDTITEWPLFSLWLGDLHPHVLAIPLLLLFVAVAGTVDGKWGVVLDAVVLAGLLAANPWDLPASLLVLAVGNLVAKPFKGAFARSVFTVLAAIPLLLPFLLAPRPAFQGIRLVARTTMASEAFFHLGPFAVIPALAMGIALLRSRERQDESFLAAMAFPALGLAAAIVTKSSVFGLSAGLVGAVIYLLPGLRGALRSGFLLAAAAAVLVSIPEVIAVKDPYGEQFHRMNTIFKCYAGGALLFWVASGLLLPMALASRRARWGVRVLLALGLLAVCAHPASLMVGRYHSLSPGTLDGLDWMTREMPGDRKAIEWLRENAPVDAVVVEATGGAYTDHSRVGSASGRPLYLGWTGHQGLWRGDAWTARIDERAQEIKTIYTSGDTAVVKKILTERKIRYVVVGTLELRDHGTNAFPARGEYKKVLDSDGTALYEVGK